MDGEVRGGASTDLRRAVVAVCGDEPRRRTDTSPSPWHQSPVSTPSLVVHKPSLPSAPPLLCGIRVPAASCPAAHEPLPSPRRAGTQPRWRARTGLRRRTGLFPAWRPSPAAWHIKIVNSCCPLRSSPHPAQKSGRVSICASSGYFAETPSYFTKLQRSPHHLDRTTTAFYYFSNRSSD